MNRNQRFEELNGGLGSTRTICSKLDLICKYVIKGGGWSIVIYSAASSRGVVFVLFCLFVKFAEKSSFVSMHIIFLQRIVVETSLV